jgi:hypothetical protein
MKRLLFIPVKTLLLGCVTSVLALVAASGCTPVFMTSDDYQQAHEPLKRHSDKHDDQLTAPITVLTKAPATVNYPDREPWYMTLQEAMAIALENGRASTSLPTPRQTLPARIASRESRTLAAPFRIPACSRAPETPLDLKPGSASRWGRAVSPRSHSSPTIASSATLRSSAPMAKIRATSRACSIRNIPHASVSASISPS